MKKLFVVLLMVTLSATALAQDTKTLFGPDTEISFVWGPEFKTTDIKGDLSTSMGFFGGALFDNAYFAGLAFGANVSHPDVNHSYFGLLTQYTHNPSELLHWSGELFLGTGTTKDYEHKKSSTMDNFGNTTGPGFYFVEPGVNAEINMSTKARLMVGLSYRIVSGLDSDDDLIAKTGVTNSDFSGFHLNIGVKVGEY